MVKKPCEHCGQKFADGGALKRLLKSHMGIKDYACTECGNAYSEKRARDNHYNIVHLGVKNFPCEQCGKMFGRSSALHVHMTKIHPHAIVKEGERKLEIPATYPALSMIPAPAADSDREPHPHPPQAQEKRRVSCLSQRSQAAPIQFYWLVNDQPLVHIILHSKLM